MACAADIVGAAMAGAPVLCAVLVTRIVVVGMLGPSVPANYRFHEKIAV